MNSGSIEGTFGVSAGVFALFFFGEVPRVRRDILQQFPFFDTYFDRRIAPEDNVSFFYLPRECLFGIGIQTLTLYGMTALLIWYWCVELFLGYALRSHVLDGRWPSVLCTTVE